jgi:hypothetical protein
MISEKLFDASELRKLITVNSGKLKNIVDMRNIYGCIMVGLLKVLCSHSCQEASHDVPGCSGIILSK